MKINENIIDALGLNEKDLEIIVETQAIHMDAILESYEKDFNNKIQDLKIKLDAKFNQLEEQCNVIEKIVKDILNLKQDTLNGLSEVKGEINKLMGINNEI